MPAADQKVRKYFEIVVLDQVDSEGARIDAGAASGYGGLWLIDPSDTTITQAAANSYTTTLTTGTSELNDLTGSITWNSGITLAATVGGASNRAALTPRSANGAGNSPITLTNASITATDGALDLVFDHGPSPTYVCLRDGRRRIGSRLACLGPRAGAGLWRGRGRPWQGRRDCSQRIVDPGGFWWAAVAAHCVDEVASAQRWVGHAREAWMQPQRPFA